MASRAERDWAEFAELGERVRNAMRQENGRGGRQRQATVTGRARAAVNLARNNRGGRGRGRGRLWLPGGSG